MEALGKAGGILAVIAGFIAAIVLLFGYVKGSSTTNWPVTEGTVASCELADVVRWPFVSSRRQHGGRGMSEVELQINYRYEVDGLRFFSDNYQMGILGSPTKPRGSEQYFSRVLGICQKYDKGLPVKVHYDPNNPEVAIIKTGYQGFLPTYLLVVVGLIAGGVYGVFRR